MKYNSSNNTPETKSYVFSKAYKKEKICMSRHFVLQYKSKIKQKNPNIYIFFNPKKKNQKIYLPSKFNLLTK